jgi:hypothetical protein
MPRNFHAQLACGQVLVGILAKKSSGPTVRQKVNRGRALKRPS